MLMTFLRSGRGIAFNQMFAMMDYPPDYMSLYAQGYSLAEFLIQTGGRRTFVKFLDDGMKDGDWSGAAEHVYRVQDLGVLQNTWLTWVKQGAPLATPARRGPLRCWPPRSSPGPSRICSTTIARPAHRRC